MHSADGHASPSPVISVITAAYRPPAEFVLDAYESLKRQTEARWEWVLQSDGSTDPPGIPTDARLRYEQNGLRLGTAGTRNRALVRARADFVFTLDIDDTLRDSALELLLRALSPRDDAAFAFGRAVEQRTDPSHQTDSHLPDPGTVPPGTLERLWHENGIPPVPGTSVLWRKEYLAAYGGWAALHGSEDTAVILAASAEHPVICVRQEVTVHRRHPGQVTASAAYHRYRQANWDFVDLRLSAMRAVAGRLPLTITGAPRAPVPETD
jgi:glycosyltransferase involved in cell wall biosynthesis